MIQVVTFDADDTLWDMTARVRSGMTVLAQAITPYLKMEAAEAEAILHATVAEIFATTDPATIDYLQARRQAIGRLLEKAGWGDDGVADEMLKVYLTGRDANYFIFPDAVETLDAIKGQYKLGWITNGTSLPHEVNLQEYFDFAIHWHTLSIRKPNRQIFEHAAVLAGCEPSQILHVGDSLEADVAGIQGVGGIGVWYNPFERPNDTNIVPDYEIHRLREVVEVLAQL